MSSTVEAPRDLGKIVSGRNWKNNDQRPSRQKIEKIGYKVSLGKRQQERQKKQILKALESELKKEKEDAVEQEKARRKEKQARREENIKKGETYQVIKNSNKLRRLMKKKNAKEMIRKIE